MNGPVLVDLPRITPTMARELAVSEHVCIRPVIRRVLDRDTGTDTTVAIACGATLETKCPPCAEKARVLRMQQCAEGWHRDHEPEPPAVPPAAAQEGAPTYSEILDAVKKLRKAVKALA